MRFTSYNAGQAQVSSPNLGMTRFRVSDQGEIAAAKESGNIGLTMAKQAADLVDRVNTAKALEANEYYNRRMTEESTALINDHKEGNAIGIDSLYDEKQKQVMDETMKRYGSYIGYGKYADSFNQFTMRDNTSRRNGIVKYQQAELEKYENTSFTNQLTDTMKTVNDDGYTDDSIDAGANRVYALCAARYGRYGEERVEMEAQKLHAVLVKNSLDYAISQQDWDRSSRMLEKYKDYIPPEMSIQYNKAVNEKLKNSYYDEQMDELYNQYGYAGAMQQLENMNTGKAGVMDVESALAYSAEIMAEGKPYELGGSGSSSYDCGLFTQTVADRGGYHFNYRTADGQYLQMENEGRLFSDSSQLKPGDIVFWHVAGNDSLWAPSDDPSAVDTNDQAYKGVTHVGIYVGDGQVRQYGSHGCKDVPVDTFDVVGYGKLSGGTKTMSREERDYCERRLGELERRKNQIEAANKKAAADSYAQRLASGEDYFSIRNSLSDAGQIEALLAAAGRLGISTRMPSSGGRYVNGQNVGNGRYTLTDDNKLSIVDAIVSGQINSADDVYAAFAEQGLALSASDRNYIEKQFRDFSKGEGNFSYDRSEVVKAVMDAMPAIPSDRKSNWKKGIEYMANVEAMKQMREGKTNYVTADAVAQAVIQAINNGAIPLGKYIPDSGYENWFGIAATQTLNPVDMYGAGYDSVVQTGDNEYELHNYNDDKWYYMTGQDIDHEIKGK